MENVMLCLYSKSIVYKYIFLERIFYSIGWDDFKTKALCGNVLILYCTQQKSSPFKTFIVACIPCAENCTNIVK